MLPLLLLIAAVALGVALGVAWLLVRFEGLHAHLSLDDTASGPQKFHSRPTPRIGGVPVICGFAAALAVAVANDVVEPAFVLAFAASIAPAFVSGLLEDITKKLGPDMRLWASFLSALVAVFFFEAVVSRSGLPGIDNLLAWYPLALIFTVIGVGGVAHAVNIIDGYNGLASLVTVLMLFALGVVSWQVGDHELVVLCVALAGATLGFFGVNFPHGRMFAGDGGAYLWGVSVGLISILLIHRHREISPWFPLVVLIYPVFETLFSVYRRKFKKAAAAGLPDAMHLHQLIYRRLLSRPQTLVVSAEAQTRRNAATAPFLWALAATAILPAIGVWQDTGALIALALVFCLLYVWLYRAIVTLSVPAWLWQLGRRAAQWAQGARPGN